MNKYHEARDKSVKEAIIILACFRKHEKVVTRFWCLRRIVNYVNESTYNLPYRNTTQGLANRPGWSRPARMPFVFQRLSLYPCP
jgi:hypothetical protein